MNRITPTLALLLLSTQGVAAEPSVTMMPLADGTRLKTMVILPDGPGPFPAIVLRTPYGLPTSPSGPVQLDDDDAAEADILATWAPVLERGFAVVQQNTRGRGGSEGLDLLFQSDRADGAALADWVVSQPWSDGTFRLTGDSADGFAGYLMAAEQPEGLTGAFFQVSCANLQELGVVRRTGGLQMEVLAPWIIQQAEESGSQNQQSWADRGVDLEAAAASGEALLGGLFGGSVEALMQRPLAALEPVAALQPAWKSFITEEGYAARADYFDAAADLAVPITHVGLWQDTFLDCTLDAFLRAGGQQSLIVMNGTHYDIDDPATWQAAGLQEAFLNWLDDVPAAPVRFAVENAPDVTPIESSTWPPKDAVPQRLFLTADGLSSDGAGAADALGTIVTDIAAAIPTEGGRNLVIEAGTGMSDLPQDGAGQIVRLAAPLTADTLLAGPVSLEVTLTSDAMDADIVARLVAVDATGKPRQILENLLRARYREGREAPAPLTPGKEVTARIELGHTAHFLRAGEQLGLILQGSNLPRWDMATGGDIDPALATTAQRITTAIGAARLDFLTLPRPIAN